MVAKNGRNSLISRFSSRKRRFFYFMLMGFSAHCLIICNSIIPREIKTHYEKWDSLRDVQTQKFSSYNNTTKVFRWVLDFVSVFQISKNATISATFLTIFCSWKKYGMIWGRLMWTVQRSVSSQEVKRNDRMSQ